MEYLNKMLDTEYKVVSFDDGNMMLKTKLKLNFASVKEMNMEKQDIQKDKKTAIAVDENMVKRGKSPEELDMILGEGFDSRRATQAIAMGTVYGIEHEIVCENRKHSIFGLNRRYVNNQGLPNETAIIKRLREVGVSHDVKEARYGLFYNAIFANDFYDNMTPLLAKIHLLQQLASITERMNTYNHVVQFGVRELEEIYKLSDELEQLEVVRQTFGKGSNAVGYSKDDPRFYQTLREVKDWYLTLPDKYIKTPSGQMENREYVSSTYNVNVKIWRMYQYDDGHSKSGQSFGSEFGFVNGKYMIPANFLKTTDKDEQVMIKAKSNHFESDASINNLKRLFGFLNGSGLSKKELTILNYLLNDYGRTTPFLCDQYVPLGIQDKKVEVVTTQIIETKQYDITADDLSSILSKLVANHRTHEDYLSAIRTTKYLICQPATETVESHWWLSNQKTVYMPMLGLKRASVYFLLMDEGICTTKESIMAASMLNNRNDRYILESLFLNTCWYWGEFMMIYNKINLMQLMKAMYGPSDDIIDEMYRADGLVSSITGLAIPLPVHSGSVTVWTRTMKENYKRVVSFGNINIRHIEDYGYTVREKKLLLHCVPAPSCVSLITGLNGSLLANTPYSAIFTSNSAVNKMVDAKVRRAMNYNDLWAMGVVSRFQGYDVTYKYPLSDNEHTIFAANNVSIALPPVGPKMKGIPQSYEICSVVERDTCFGTNPEFMMGCECVVYWNRHVPIPQSRPTYSAHPKFNKHDEVSKIREFETYIDESKTYTTLLLAQYDINMMSFLVTEQVAAVPPPDQAGALILQEELHEPQPVDET